jgi:hypothetical protein
MAFDPVSPTHQRLLLGGLLTTFVVTVACPEDPPGYDNREPESESQTTKSEGPPKSRRERLEQFLGAWVGRQFSDAYDLMEPDYRKDVTRSQFIAAATEHPFIEAPQKTTITKESGSCFRVSLQHAKGPVTRLHADVIEVHGRWWIDDIETYSDSIPFVFAHLRYPNQRRGYEFMNALRHRRWAAAWELTHPFYREYVSATTFARTLTNNIWLQGGGSIRLDVPKGGSRLLLVGTLANATNAVTVELHLAEHKKQYWVTEVRLGGAPTFPQPKRVRLRAEAE